MQRKSCIEPGCKKLPREMSDKCVEHGGGRCSEPGCKSLTRIATYMSDKCTKHGGGLCIEPGCKNVGIMMSNWCKKHGGGKICIEPGCTHWADWTAEKMGDKCWDHRISRCVEPGCINEVNMKGEMCWYHKQPRCNEPDCRTPVWNVANSLQRQLRSNPTPSACSSNMQLVHAALALLVMRGENGTHCREHHPRSRCIEPGCSKSGCAREPYMYYGVLYTPLSKCIDHGGGRCTEPECKKWDAGGGKCIKHGGGIRCIESGCTKSAAVVGNGIGERCKAHGGGDRCPNCITWPDSRCGSKEYDGYCATCFKHLFPNDERSKVIYIHTKEIRVRNTINEHFEGFIHDKPLYTGHCDCTHRRRIDHRKLFGATLLCVETDEFAHSNYDSRDEEIRYDDLYMVHSGKWVFVRFNPDGKGVDMVDKLYTLVEEIKTQINRIESYENTELLEIIKLFY